VLKQLSNVVHETAGL